MTHDETDGFSQKDILIKFIIPRLDQISEKLDSKANSEALDALEREVISIREHGSPSLIRVQEIALKNTERISSVEKEQAVRQVKLKEHDEMKEDIGSLKTWRTRLAVIGSIIVLILPASIGATTYLWAKPGHDLASQNKTFLEKQCHRDRARDDILSMALRDAIRRVDLSVGSSQKKEQAKSAIQRSIDQLHFLDQDCSP